MINRLVIVATFGQNSTNHFQTILMVYLSKYMYFIVITASVDFTKPLVCDFITLESVSANIPLLAVLCKYSANNMLTNCYNL